MLFITELIMSNPLSRKQIIDTVSMLLKEDGARRSSLTAMYAVNRTALEKILKVLQTKQDTSLLIDEIQLLFEYIRDFKIGLFETEPRGLTPFETYLNIQQKDIKTILEYCPKDIGWEELFYYTKTCQNLWLTLKKTYHPSCFPSFCKSLSGNKFLTNGSYKDAEENFQILFDKLSKQYFIAPFLAEVLKLEPRMDVRSLLGLLGIFNSHYRYTDGFYPFLPETSTIQKKLLKTSSHIHEYTPVLSKLLIYQLLTRKPMSLSDLTSATNTFSFLVHYLEETSYLPSDCKKILDALSNHYKENGEIDAESLLLLLDIEKHSQPATIENRDNRIVVSVPRWMADEFREINFNSLANRNFTDSLWPQGVSPNTYPEMKFISRVLGIPPQGSITAHCRGFFNDDHLAIVKDFLEQDNSASNFNGLLVDLLKSRKYIAIEAVKNHYITLNSPRCLPLYSLLLRSFFQSEYITLSNFLVSHLAKLDEQECIDSNNIKYIKPANIKAASEILINAFSKPIDEFLNWLFLYLLEGQVAPNEEVSESGFYELCDIIFELNHQSSEAYMRASECMIGLISQILLDEEEITLDKNILREDLLNMLNQTKNKALSASFLSEILLGSKLDQKSDLEKLRYPGVNAETLLFLSNKLKDAQKKSIEQAKEIEELKTALSHYKTLKNPLFPPSPKTKDPVQKNDAERTIRKRSSSL